MRIRGATQIVQVCREGEKLVKGSAMRQLAILKEDLGRKLGLVVDKDGKVDSIGFVLC